MKYFDSGLWRYFLSAGMEMGVKYSQDQLTGAPNVNFRKNICSGDDLRSRIFGTFVLKFLACLPLLGFSNT